jgi:hypothetical protein
MVCIRGTAPAGPNGWTYSAFFKTQYVQSRYSADNDCCGAQQYHPFVELSEPTESPLPSPSPASAPKKRGKRHP